MQPKLDNLTTLKNWVSLISNKAIKGYEENSYNSCKLHNLVTRNMNKSLLILLNVCNYV
jgi:hypothetical protein